MGWTLHRRRDKVRMRGGNVVAPVRGRELTTMHLAILLATAMVGQYDAIAHVNAIRAEYTAIDGIPRPAVTWDQSAADTSARNNSYQRVGHFDYDGPQDSAMAPDTASAFAMWKGSPAHLAMILDPSLTSVGYHQNGWFHTLTGRSGDMVYRQRYTTTTTPTGYRTTYRESLRPAGFHPFKALGRALFGRQ